MAVRCLNAVTMPHIDRQFSLFSSTGEPGESDGGSLELSNELIAEIIESDAIVLATPMHNLSIPSALKAWIDHVVRPNITFRYSQRKTIGLLEDKPVFVVLSKAEDVWTQDQPDFLRPYLRTMLASIGIRSVEFFGLEGHKGAGRGIVTAAEATEIFSRCTPSIAHQAIYSLWSQYW